MKHFLSALFALSCLVQFSLSSPVLAAEPAPLLPESLAAREQMAASMKTHTIFFKAEDPQKATDQLNQSNEEYAKRGWNVFAITPYLDNGDFNGFFVTYQKTLVIN